MKQTFTSKRAPSNLLRKKILLFTLILLNGAILHAQVKKRTYANFQETSIDLGTVSDNVNAIDSNLSTASTLSVGLGILNAITASQHFVFSTAKSKATARTIPANSPVTIKVELPKSILGVLDNIYIQPINIVAGSRSNAGSSFSGATLVSLINGAQIAEITIAPSVSYQGVSVTLGSVAGVGVTMKIYDVFVQIDDAIPLPSYTSRIDVLYGQRATIAVDLASSTGFITNPENSIDTDPALSTFSVLGTGVELLGAAYIRGIFAMPSAAGDSVAVYVQNPSADLLDLTALGGVKVQPYLGNSPAGGPIYASNSLVKLKLLSGPENILAVTAPVASAFDRVDVSIEGVANALTTIRVYDINRIAADLVLPVTISSFSGKANNGKTILTWDVENESNIAKYDIQKSTDGHHYKTIGLVLPSEISSNNSYTFIDENADLGNNYYRLFIKDKDGSSKYSSIVTISNNVKNPNSIVVAPNPIKTAIRVKMTGLENGAHKLELYNLSGQLQKSKNIHINQSEQIEYMDRDALNTGIYMLAIYNKNNKLIQTVKLVIE